MNESWLGARTWSAGIALALAAAFSAAACGGSDSSAAAPNEGTGGLGGESGTGGGQNGTGGGDDACGDRVPETVAFDDVFWSGGFKVTLGEGQLVAATAECPVGSLTIDAQFENRSSESWGFEERVLLTSQGTSGEGSLDTPDVPGLTTGKGSFAFSVDEDFTLDDAFLTVGGAGAHQAIVPLGDASTETLVSLEPALVTPPAEFSSLHLSFNITEIQVRADTPNHHANFNDDTLEIRMVLDVTNISDSQKNFSDDYWALELPDGTSVGVSQLNSYDLLGAGETAQDQVVFFEVSVPYEGTYKLSAGSSSANDVDGIGTFEIPHLAAFGD